TDDDPVRTRLSSAQPPPALSQRSVVRGVRVLGGHLLAVVGRRALPGWGSLSVARLPVSRRRPRRLTRRSRGRRRRRRAVAGRGAGAARRRRTGRRGRGLGGTARGRGGRGGRGGARRARWNN